MSDQYKHDGGKDRWDLLPVAPVREIVKVLTFGAQKYAPNSWQLVPDGRNRYYAAALRHLTAWRDGEDMDSESGLPHLAHAMCDLAFIRELDREAEVQAERGANATEQSAAVRHRFAGMSVTTANALLEAGTVALPTTMHPSPRNLSEEEKEVLKEIVRREFPTRVWYSPPSERGAKRGRGE